MALVLGVLCPHNGRLIICGPLFIFISFSGTVCWSISWLSIIRLITSSPHYSLPNISILFDFLSASLPFMPSHATCCVALADNTFTSPCVITVFQLQRLQANQHCNLRLLSLFYVLFCVRELLLCYCTWSFSPRTLPSVSFGVRSQSALRT